jgi:hypothetical protein
VCGRDVALRKGGLIREHQAPPRLQHKTLVCLGSGRVAVGRQTTVDECIAELEAEAA